MKIYIVTDGEYSDYNIEAVFADERKAKVFAATHGCDNIEEFETHDDQIDGDTTVYVVYTFVVRFHEFTLDKAYYSTNKRSCINKGAYSDYVVVSLDEKEADEAKARKIAQDMYSEYKAQKSGAYL